MQLIQLIHGFPKNEVVGSTSLATLNTSTVYPCGQAASLAVQLMRTDAGLYMILVHHKFDLKVMVSTMQALVPSTVGFQAFCFGPFRGNIALTQSCC